MESLGALEPMSDKLYRDGGSGVAFGELPDCGLAFPAERTGMRIYDRSLVRSCSAASKGSEQERYWRS